MYDLVFLLLPALCHWGEGCQSKKQWKGRPVSVHTRQEKTLSAGLYGWTARNIKAKGRGRSSLDFLDCAFERKGRQRDRGGEKKRKRGQFVIQSSFYSQA